MVLLTSIFLCRRRFLSCISYWTKFYFALLAIFVFYLCTLENIAGDKKGIVLHMHYSKCNINKQKLSHAC